MGHGFVEALQFVFIVESFFLQLRGNDHRWTAKFAKALCLSSSSKSFYKTSRPSWEAALKQVHKVCWERWHNYKEHDRSSSPFQFLKYYQYSIADCC